LKSLARLIARVVGVGVVCAVATIWLGWLPIPAIGFAYGLADRSVDRSMRGRGSIAGLGAALGWAAIIGEEAARGADIRTVANQLGALMQISGVGLVLVTLAFAAVLCGASALLGSIAGDTIFRRRGDYRDTKTALKRQ
jgi:hypothetical protein